MDFWFNIILNLFEIYNDDMLFIGFIIMLICLHILIDAIYFFGFEYPDSEVCPEHLYYLEEFEDPLGYNDGIDRW